MWDIFRVVLQWCRIKRTCGHSHGTLQSQSIEHPSGIQARAWLSMPMTTWVCDVQCYMHPYPRVMEAILQLLLSLWLQVPNEENSLLDQNPVVKLYQNQLACSPLVSLHSPLSYGNPFRSDRCSVLSCLVSCDLLSEVLRWPRSPGQSSCRRPTRKAILSIAMQSIISSERDTVWKCLLPVGYFCLAAAWTLFELCWLWNETTTVRLHRVTCQLKFFRDSMQHLNWMAWGDFSFSRQNEDSMFRESFETDSQYKSPVGFLWMYSDPSLVPRHGAWNACLNHSSFAQISILQLPLKRWDTAWISAAFPPTFIFLDQAQEKKQENQVSMKDKHANVSLEALLNRLLEIRQKRTRKWTLSASFKPVPSPTLRETRNRS